MSQKHTSVQIKTDIYQNVPLNCMNQGSISKSATVECGSSIASHQIEWGCLREIYCQHEAKHLEHQSMNIPSQKNRKRSKYIQYIQVRSFPCFPDLHFERLYKKGRCTGTKKRAYGRCSRREIKGNEISTEPVLHNGSQPCHIPGANICLNGVEPFGKI